MAATKDQAVMDLANTLTPAEIPVKLRCATCSKLSVNAFRLPCCDQSICERCQSTLSDPCPVCMHSPLDPSTCVPNKSLRLTVKAFLKAEEKKRAKGSISAKKTENSAPAESKVSAPSVEPPVEVAPQAPAEPVEPGADSAISTTTGSAGEHQTEVTENNIGSEHVQPESNDNQEQHEAVEDATDHTQEQSEEHAEDQEGNNEDWQANQGMNPMMGMSNTGFSNFSGMMGMPNMAMGMPSMFGGFGGMGMGDMSSMNMGMGMNGLGWNSQQGYGGNFGYYPNGGYNQPYGNQMRQYPNQGYSNRFRGQGPYRSRGRGYHGRGNFNQRFQNYDNQQDWSNNGGYGDFNNQGYGDVNGQYQAGAQMNDQYDEAQQADRTNQDDTGGQNKDVSALPNTNASDVATEQPGNGVEAVEGHTGQEQGDYTTEDQNGHNDAQHAAMEQSTSFDPANQVSEPPLNAPTGPKAMRDRRSRGTSYAQSSHEDRRGSNAVSESRTHTRFPHENPDMDSDERVRDASRDDKHKRDDRQRSRSPRQDEDYSRRRDRKRRLDDRYGEDTYDRPSKSGRHGRSKDTDPEDDRDSHSSRYEKDKHKSSRSHRDEHESSRDRHRRKDRSRYDDKDDRGSDRDRRKHDRRYDREEQRSRDHRDRSDRSSKQTKHSTRTEDDEDDFQILGRRNSEIQAAREKETMRINITSRDTDAAESKSSHRRQSSHGGDGLGKRVDDSRDSRGFPSAESVPLPADDDIGFKIKGSHQRHDEAAAAAAAVEKRLGAAPPTGPRRNQQSMALESTRRQSFEARRRDSLPKSTTTADPYAQEREARQKERMEKEQRRRQSATLGKRGREDDVAPPTGPRADARKRGRVSYEGEMEDDGRKSGRRESKGGRWR